tara:strand:+ start:406 stop:669 length:264 start_codon:yes stop_codon:yes gene_type:complete
MANADDILLEMLKGLKEDVSVIRDNHLAHIGEDIQSIKAEQVAQRKDIDDLMAFKSEITDCIKSSVNRLLAGIAGITTAVLGGTTLL